MISILKSKIFVVEGKIEQAIDELQNALAKANENNYTKLVDDINKQIRLIHDQIGKWGAKLDILERIKAVDMELYIKEASKIAGFESR